MPTYQYSCTECGHFFEQFQSFSEDSLTECPQCQGRLRKLFNAVGVVFKGSGFYRNDSRAPEASVSSEKKSDTKTDTKTDSTNGSKPDSASPKTEKKADSKPSTAAAS